VVVVIMLCAVLIATLNSACFAAETDSVIIVSPARFRVVKLMHDVRRMRDVTVITCQGEADDESPAIHALNRKGWSSVNVAAYINMVAGRTVLLIGSDEVLPNVILGASGQAKRLKRIETLDVGTILADLKKSLKLSGGEVKLLARRHGLSVTDGNRELRRWGRYGKPGTKKPPEATSGTKEAAAVVSDKTMPPRNVGGTKSDGMPDEPELESVEDAFLKKLLMEKGDSDEAPVETALEEAPEEVSTTVTEELLPEDK
jgi:hypothetical protein